MGMLVIMLPPKPWKMLWKVLDFYPISRLTFLFALCKIRWIFESDIVIIIGLVRWWFQLQLLFLEWLSASPPFSSYLIFLHCFSCFKICICRIYHTSRERCNIYKHRFITDNKVYPHVSSTQGNIWTGARPLEVSHMPFSNGKPSLYPRMNHCADFSQLVLVTKNLSINAGHIGAMGTIPGLWRLWRRAYGNQLQYSPRAGESLGQRSSADYSPCGCRVVDTTDAT